MFVGPLHTPVAFTPDLPGSKSHANRALVLAALSDGPFRIEGATPCDDVVLMVRGLQSLGFEIDWVDRAAGIVEGVGGLPSQAPSGPVTIDCELAGTTLRFLCAIAALVPGEWVLDGNERMRTRPIGPLVAALRALGVEVDAPSGCPPVSIRGATAGTSVVDIDASVSSQFLSALLLVGCRWPGGLDVSLTGGELASPGYVEITEQVMAAFGVESERDQGGWKIEERSPACPRPFRVEPDASGAGPWSVLGWALRNSWGEYAFSLPPAAGGSKQPDWGIVSQLYLLEGVGPRVIDLSQIPDQAMNLAVAAACRAGVTQFVGGATLRLKESDRIGATVAMLRAVDVEAYETNDGFVVVADGRIGKGRVETHGDHRLAIAGSLLGLLGEGIEIDDPSCVEKSYPNWFAEADRARELQIHLVLVGMRGAGKTTLGKALATVTGRRFFDSDEVFESFHGPLPKFVERHGWERFRELEYELISDLIGIRRGGAPLVVALGGGAIHRLAGFYSPQLVSHQAAFACIWVQERMETLIQRVAASDRPSLTGRPPTEELESVYEERAPLYAQLADLVSPPGLTVDQRVNLILRSFGNR